MTQDRSVDERISAWLLEEAPDQLPDRVLQATFERTRASRRRRVFLGWRFPMIRITPTAIAVGAAAILVIAVGVTLLPRPNQAVGGPGPSPSASPTPTPTTRPTPSLDPVSLTGQIAFERTVDGNTDIYLMNLDRSGLVRLTDDPASDTNPGWSPDGTRIVFTRDVDGSGELFTMTADGGDETRLTTTPDSEDFGRFSPDGQTIAFWGGAEANVSELLAMDADGANRRQIIRFVDTFVGAVAWTADGKAILFNRDLSSGGEIDIVRVDLDTKAVTQVTNSPGDDSSFAVSNDGSTIAFQSDRAPGGIFLMDVDGENVRHVTGTWMKGYPVSWSVDGDHLVYSQPDGWLYLVRTDGTGVTTWTQGGLQVAWRPGS